jgi:membrane protein DedA with SNARE-associated domain
VLCEQAGLPLPAVPVLLAAGALAGQGKLSLLATLLLTVSACLLADFSWFALGRRHGARVLRLLCRISLEPDSCVRRTENVFARSGAKTLLFAKFVPGLSAVATPVAGLIRMRPSRFLLWDGGGALLWSSAYLGAGYLASDELEAVADVALGLGGRLGFVLGGAFAAWLFWKYVQRRRFIREISVARITPDELRQKLDAGEDIVVVDLRDSLEFEADTGAVPGALHMLPDELDARHEEIPRDREVILYCT